LVENIRPVNKNHKLRQAGQMTEQLCSFALNLSLFATVTKNKIVFSQFSAAQKHG